MPVSDALPVAAICLYKRLTPVYRRIPVIFLFIKNITTPFKSQYFYCEQELYVINRNFFCYLFCNIVFLWWFFPLFPGFVRQFVHLLPPVQFSLVLRFSFRYTEIDYWRMGIWQRVILFYIQKFWKKPDMWSAVCPGKGRICSSLFWIGISYGWDTTIGLI